MAHTIPLLVVKGNFPCNTYFGDAWHLAVEISSTTDDPLYTVCRSFPGGNSDFVTVDPSTTHETRHVIDAGEHPSMGSAKAEFNDAQYVKDLRGAFSSVPRPKARWQDRYMKLMIVGETGQGRVNALAHLLFCLSLPPPTLWAISPFLHSAPKASLQFCTRNQSQPSGSSMG